MKSGEVPSLLLLQERYFIFNHLKAAAVSGPQITAGLTGEESSGAQDQYKFHTFELDVKGIIKHILL